MIGIRSVAGRLLRSGFPDCCVLCGSAEAHDHFCLNCLLDLPRISIACNRCGVPLAVAVPAGVDCDQCQLRPPPFHAARAALLYTFPVDAALKALKFKRQLYYVPAFAELLEPFFLHAFPQADALVPVPLHRWRHAVRGFNQARELCKPIARRRGLPLVENAKRVRRTRPQSGLSAAERRRNLHDAFALRGPLRSRHPLIVDDVMTTGETCRQLALTLLDAGAEDVGVLTVARAASVR